MIGLAFPNEVNIMISEDNYNFMHLHKKFCFENLVNEIWNDSILHIEFVDSDYREEDEDEEENNQEDDKDSYDRDAYYRFPKLKVKYCDYKNKMKVKVIKNL